MPLAIVQKGSATFGNEEGGDTRVFMKLPGAPTTGNLLIAMLVMQDNQLPSVAAGWTAYATLQHQASGFLQYWGVYYKYAGASEPANQIIDINAHSNWSTTTWEISGTSGVIGTDVASLHISTVWTATSVAVGSFNTLNANNLVLAGFFGLTFGTTAATIPGFSGAGWTGDTSENFSTGANQLWSSVLGEHQAFVSSGSTISGTVTAQNAVYVFIELKATAGGSTETATANMALHGVSFNVQAQHAREAATATMALSGVTIKASAVDLGAPGSGAVQFSTFGA